MKGKTAGQGRLLAQICDYNLLDAKQRSTWHSQLPLARRKYTNTTQAVSNVAHQGGTKDPFLIERKQSGFWKNRVNQKAFLDRLANELGISQMSDWYAVQREDVVKRGGSRLFGFHQTLEMALRAIYPEYPWESDRFAQTRIPPGYWKNENNLSSYFDKAEKALGIATPEDWKSISIADLKQTLGCPRTLTRPKLVELLNQRYPGHTFEKIFQKGKYMQQKRLEKAVSMLFKENMITNARKEPDVINPETGDYLELDIYIPSLKLAFEYNEKHHYTSNVYAHKPLPAFQERDNMKKELVKEKGITLISIPYWWDGTLPSLIATIKTARPDLLQEHSDVGYDKAIPSNKPESTEAESVEIEGIGEPSNACFLSFSNINPEKWWIFEKYDGVRGFWNPATQAIYSRKGNKFSLPSFIINTLPADTFLDGELWFGRDNFQESLKISNRVDESSIDWTKFKYMVYDIPKHYGTYAERYSVLQELFKSPHPYIEVAPKEECKGMDHLEAMFQDIIDKGGEGVILRDPLAPYQTGRTPGYLKHKKYRDAEARIVGILNNQWECEMPNGVTFVAGAATSNFVKKWVPKIGDIVSFKHYGFLLGTKKPKLPVLYRLRPDLTWDDVILNWKERKPSMPQVVGPRLTKREHIKPKSYWNNIANRRKYFHDLAEELGFDPMVTSNWKNVTVRSLASTKVGYGPILKYKGSLKRALTVSFPELDFEKLKEPKAGRGHWKDVNNCRVFFDEFAKENSFDPLHAESWYSVDLQKMEAKKGGHRILHYFGGFKEALKQCYPELNFTKWKRSAKAARLTWADPLKCRRFFDEYATDHGFDPLNPANWYTINLEQMLKRKGGRNVQGYNDGFKGALKKAYPEMKFTKWESHAS